MQKTLLSNLDETWDNVFENFHWLILWKSPFFLEKAREITFITKFSNNITMSSFSDNIDAVKNILMFEGFKCFNFTVEHFPTDTVFDSFHINAFNSDCFICMLIDSFVYNWAIAFSDSIVGIVRVIFDPNCIYT